ncbi:hypothetical protein QYE76_067716 [Lolium multiflorum]|uniref:Uncharacterized protein n=1 Tax=Lolium multiflorum TaxID=4521 RepID=A0AAD8SCX9_LOLMU|nr:hypothetical protein QYE76_067716 [Lolium multiflorum]
MAGVAAAMAAMPSPRESRELGLERASERTSEERDCDPEVEAINDGAPEGSYELVYEEPDLTGGVEGVDYGIVYGPDDTEVEE